MNLLHAFILKQDPSAFVHVQTTWPPGKSDLSLDERLRLVDLVYPRCNNSRLAYLLFDEGKSRMGTDLFGTISLRGSVTAVTPLTALSCFAVMAAHLLVLCLIILAHP